MPLEDTYILEGLLQGPVPARAESAAALQAMMDGGMDRKVPLSLRIESGQFSLLADEKEHDTRAFAPLTMSDTVQKSLHAVLQLLTPPERMQAFSTLRSREFRAGQEHQTLYQIVPPGMVAVQTREIDADVRARPKPWSRREKAIIIAGATGLIGIAIAISTLFVDYRELFGRTLSNLRGTTLGDVRVEAPALEGYLRVEVSGLNLGKDALTLTLSRGPKWDEALRTTPAGAADWPSFLAIAAIQKRYVTVFLKNPDNEIIRTSVVPLDDLAASPTATFSIGFGKGEVVKTIVVRPS